MTIDTQATLVDVRDYQRKLETRIELCLSDQ